MCGAFEYGRVDAQSSDLIARLTQEKNALSKQVVAQRRELASAKREEDRLREMLADNSEESENLLDESLEIAGALGIDISDDYHLPTLARRVREERDRAVSRCHELERRLADIREIAR